MPLQLLLTTSGSKSPIYADGRRITHPTSGLNLLEQSTIRRLQLDSQFLADHAAGHFTLALQNGQMVTSGLVADVFEPQIFGRLNNFTALAPPTASDDSSKGYGIGSRWTDNLARVGYECTKATNPATWRATTHVNPGTGFVAQASVFGSDPEQSTSSQAVNGIVAYTHSYTPPEAGDFIAWWYFELTANSNKGVEGRILVDGVEVGTHTHFPGLGDSYTGFSGLISLTWGTIQHDITVRFRSLQSSNNARIRRIRTEVLKVA